MTIYSGNNECDNLPMSGTTFKVSAFALRRKQWNGLQEQRMMTTQIYLASLDTAIINRASSLILKGL